MKKPPSEFDYSQSREEQRRALRSAILEAAAQLLADRGMEQMSVRAIAERVGASTKVIYSHFGGKPGIIEALYRDGFGRLAEVIRQAAELDGTAQERLMSIADAYRAFAVESPALYELMFGPRVRELLPTTHDRDPVMGASGVIAELLRSGQSDGTIKTGDVHRQTKFVWSALHATVSLELMDWFTGDEAIDNHHRLVGAALESLLA